MPTPGMGPPSGPNTGPPSQQVVIQQSPSATPTTPVQVTQSGSQVQVNRNLFALNMGALTALLLITFLMSVVTFIFVLL